MTQPQGKLTTSAEGTMTPPSSLIEGTANNAPATPTPMPTPPPLRVGICYLRPTAAEHRGVGLCVMFRAALASAGCDFAEAPVSGDLQLPAAAAALATAGAAIVVALFPKSCNANRTLSGLLAAAAAGCSVPLLHGEYSHDCTEANPDAELQRLKGEPSLSSSPFVLALACCRPYEDDCSSGGWLRC